MDGKTIGALVVVLIVAFGGWYLYSSKTPAPAAVVETAASSTASTDTSINPQSENVTITYTDQGFSPKEVTIPQGATVTWVNQSANEMWVASAPHPAHTGYDGTSRSQHCVAGYAGAAPFDECASAPSGGTYSFTFDRVGTWLYHNHNSAGDSGTVVVAAPSVNVSGGANVTL